MAQECYVCKKSVRFGNTVSHSHHKTKRKWYPNLQNVRIITSKGVKKVTVCTKCLKSGQVKKAI